VLWIAAACSATGQLQDSAQPPAPISPTVGEPAQPPAPTAAPSPTAAPAPQPTPSPEPRPVLVPITSPFKAPSSWASPLPNDPELIEGQLDNGLRYLVLANERPGGQATMRLALGAGAVDDDPEHSGTAHFLEHMMFNGTERFPGNELIPILAAVGAEFGADVNAYTSFDETVYQVTVPTDAEADIQLGLDVLEQWAGFAELDPDAVIAERGVIREELRRANESASARVLEAIREVAFADTPYLGLETIGSVESVDAMDVDAVRAFYERWYRPDLFTVVAVGDFDPSAVESRIIETFGGLETPEEPAPVSPEVPDGFDPGLREPVYDVLVDRELETIDVEVSFRVARPTIVSRNDLRSSLVERLALSLLNERLFATTNQADSAFLSLRASRSGLATGLGLVGVSGEVGASDVESGLEQMLKELEQVRQHPVAPLEWSRGVERFEGAIAQSFAESATVQDLERSHSLVGYALLGEPVVAPDEWRQVQTTVLASIAPIDVQVYFDTMLRTNPYVLVTGPASVEDVLPEPEALAAVVDAYLGWPVAPAEIADDVRDELMAAPEPGAIVSEEWIEGLNATVITFDNGVRMAWRPTQVIDGLIEFQAWSRGGFFAEDESVAPMLSRTASLVHQSGFASLDTVELSRVIAGEQVSLSGSIGRASEQLVGEASTNDVETLFQMIHLQLTEPAIEPLPLRRLDQRLRPLITDPSIRPALAADLELWRLRYGDSPWFRLLPTIDELDAYDLDGQLEAWKRRYENPADFVFVFVGDIDADDIRDLGARYLATLPTNDAFDQTIDREPGVPEENLVSTVAAGVGDQASVRINWESPLPFTLEAAVKAEALELLVSNRMREFVREELGASYSVSVEVIVLSEPVSWVDSVIETSTDPELADSVSAAIRDELARIRAGEFDQADLDVVISQLREDYRYFSNDDWLELVTFALANPDRPAGEYSTRRDIASTFTIGDIAEMAQVVFPEQRSVEVRLLPE